MLSFVYDFYLAKDGMWCGLAFKFNTTQMRVDISLGTFTLGK